MIELIYIFIGLIFSQLSSHFIFGGDSGEFATVALSWSIAHPPGYPLYSLLSNIIRFLPLGTLPWRVSLLSVIPAVITSYMIFKILRIHSHSIIISFLSSLLFLILFPVWQYSLIPEVFLLSTMLVACATYCVFSYLRYKKHIYLYFFALLVGLNVAHHHIFILFIPAWFILLRRIFPLKNKVVFICLLFFIIGALFYLYAPIASLFNPPLDWENAKTGGGFFRLISRSTYGTFSAYRGSVPEWGNLLYDFLAIILFVIQDFRIPGILLLFIGIAMRKHTNTFLFRFLIVSSVFHIGFLTYTNFVLTIPFSTAMYERFLINFYFLLCLLIGTSIHFITLRFPRYRQYLIGLVAIYIVILGGQNWPSIRNIKSLTHFDRLGKDILATVPHNGIFSTGNDNSYFSATYYHYGLKKRQDLTMLHLNRIKQTHYLMELNTKGRLVSVPQKISDTNKSLSYLFKANEKRGIYLENPMQFGYWLPYGLLWKYYSEEKAMRNDVKNVITANSILWNDVYTIPKLAASEKNILHLQVVQDYYIKSYMNFSKLLFVDKKYVEAIKLVKNVIAVRPNDHALKMTLLNMLVYQKKCKEAIAFALTISMPEDFANNNTGVNQSIKDFSRTCKVDGTRIILRPKK